MTNFKINNDNVITAAMEDLIDEECQMYLVAEQHLKDHFLKGFKKGRGDTVTRVQDFVMPSFKVSRDKVEVIDVPTSPPNVNNNFNQHVLKSEEIFANYIVCLERLEDIVKEKSATNNYTTSTDSHGVVHPSLSAISSTPENI